MVMPFSISMYLFCSMIVPLSISMYLFLFFLFFISSQCSLDNSLEKEFHSYVDRFHKVYADPSERDYRMKIFYQNHQFIQEHNNKQQSYTLGVTPFTDLTNEEFKHRFVFNTELMKRREQMESFSSRKDSEKSYSLPKSVDWREKNAVSSVKNQKSCGSCWAFSAVGAIEGAYAIQDGILEDLSPQHLVDCDTSDNGCSGGLMSNAFEFIMQRGITTESEYPYRGNEGSCKNPQVLKSILGYYDVPAGSGYELQKAITKNPVSVAIEADSAVFQNYVSGVIDDSSCGSSLNHGVLVIGFEQNTRIPYYIVKNSWGENWGENGFVRLAINDSYAGMCGIHLMGSYPFLDV